MRIYSSARMKTEPRADGRRRLRESGVRFRSESRGEAPDLVQRRAHRADVALHALDPAHELAGEPASRSRARAARSATRPRRTARSASSWTARSARAARPAPFALRAAHA